MAIDLTVSNVVIDKTYYLPNDRIEISWDLNNLGTTASPSTRSGIYISEDAIYDSSDIFLTSEYLSSILGLTTTSQNDGYSLQYDFAPGEYYIIIHADYLEQRSESNETNNWAASNPFTITADPAYYHDVSVSNFQITSTSFQHGDTITFTFDYFNHGGVAAVDYEFDVRFSPDSFMSGGDDHELVYQTTIAAGTGGTYSGSFILDADDPSEIGDVYFQIVGDEGEQLSDPNRANDASNVISAEVGATPQDDPHYGFHIGWYYEIEATPYSTTTYSVDWHDGWYLDIGWFNGWNVGWHNGWNYGWYNPGTGWSFGWNVGWYYGWGVSWYYGWGYQQGWYYGWGATDIVEYYYTLGDLKYGTQENPYLGWGMTDLGVGIGLAMDPTAIGSSHQVEYQGSYIVKQLTLESASYVNGWTYGWYNGGGGWAVGWHVATMASATFGYFADVSDGYYFVGWVGQFYSPVSSWDYETDFAYGLTWGWNYQFGWASF